MGSQKYVRPHWVGAGLREDWISDLTLAVVIPFGGRGGKGRCEQWGLAPPLFCRLGLINGATHPVDQPPGRINGVGLLRCSTAWV